ncbi:MAG TPA: SusC/RagA family TonB-linked outer membrane protein [Longimicrobiales bacterium]|nr:SusC/RagA family TonB-linked outer membrane protein [Longimicrobiales bacterium]
MIGLTRRCALGALALVLTLSGGARAQSAGSVRGTVTDAVTRRPLAGAQVYIVGTRLGALTDERGVYTIGSVPIGSHAVRVEMLGFRTVDKPVTVAADQPAMADFELGQAAIALDQVVVTGTAGATTKRAVGNTVASIKAAEITQSAPTSNVQQLLSARTPGVTIMSNAGTVGSSSRIRVRGAGSINAGTQPVVYVDGVRIVSNTDGGFDVAGGIVQGTSPLDAINPEDIESIELIKGPAAATLYGAEAANGVIQIITKKGRGTGGGIHWNLSVDRGNIDWTLPQPTNYTLCGAYHVKDAASNYPGCAGQSPTTLITQTPLTSAPARSADDLETGRSWIRTGQTTNVNLSAQGGGSNYNYYLSAETNNETGVFYNNYNRRQSGRANFGFVPNERLNFNVSVGYARQHIQLPLNDNASNGILRNSWRGQPGANAPWRAGYRGLSPDIGNTFNNQTYVERTTIGLTTNYNPFSIWSNRLTLGLDKADRNNFELFLIDQTGKAPFGGEQALGALYNLLPSDHVWTIDYSSTLTNKLTAQLNNAFSVGMQYNRKEYKNTRADGIGFVSDKVNLISTAATTRARDSLSTQSSLGFYAQDQVGVKERLYLTGAVRIDNNSAFGEQVNLVVYPKASVSYILSEEPWFHLPAVDELKVRAAWGRAGRAPAPFSADRTFAGRVASVPQPSGGDLSQNQVEPQAYGNPDLKAETGDEIETGFEASLLKNRLGVDFTFYYQRTKDALMAIPDPRSAGFTATHLINIGEIKNRGLELQLNATPVYTRALRWDATISASTNKNKLVSFGTGQTSIDFGAFATTQRFIEGYPLGGYWYQDVKRDASGQPTFTRDSRGRPVVTVDPAYHFVGPQIPTRQVGLTNTFTVLGNVRFFSHFDYQGGHYMWCAICSVRTRLDHNTEAINQPLNTFADTLNYAVLNSLQTKTWITPADFIKLRELSVTYTVPQKYTQRVRAGSASITLAGRNLWMWTKYEGVAGKGKSDPEVSFYSTPQSALNGGDFNLADYDAVPMLRRLVATVRLSF